MLMADPRVSPQANDNYAIRCAGCSGHIEIVKMLLMDSRVSPQTGYDLAMPNQCCFGLLFLDDRVNMLFPQYLCVVSVYRYLT